MSLQVAAEERIGHLIRENARQRRAEEDAAYAALHAAVGG